MPQVCDAAISNETTLNKPFLKWAGGKTRIMEKISPFLPFNQQRNGNTCLIEPFVGSGAVFMNTDYDEYLLFDINPDLIHLFNIVKQDVERYIQASRRLFEHSQFNTETYYYEQRTRFNRSTDLFERACIFLYLNRLGYNGLCRYNLKGQFNVPFGRYKTVYYPEKELRHFAEKAQRATFICGDFTQAFLMAENMTKHCVIYCDPPYVPLSATANFTTYASNKFGDVEQMLLADLAKTAAKNNTPVVISNHDTPFTRRIYQGAKFKRFKVRRHISQSAEQRNQVMELLAIWNPYFYSP